MTRSSWAIFGVASLVVLVRSLDPSEFNWDVAWLLYVGERVFDGAELYVDIHEENPPVIVWLSMIPAALSRVSGLPAIVLYDALVAALTLLSAVLSTRIMVETWPEWPREYRSALTSLLICLATIAPGIDFGQRENLLFIAFVPYLFSASATLAGRPLATRRAILVGLFCAPAIALKPFFALPWIAVEATVLLVDRTRWRCPENFIIGGFVGILYLWLLAFNPAYRTVLELTIMVAAEYQGSGVAAMRLPTLAVAAAATLAFAAFRPPRFGSELRRLTLVAALAFLAMAIVQGADFSYRYFPAEALGWLVIGIIVLGLTAAPEELGQILRVAPARVTRAVMAVLLLWCVGTLGFATKQTFAKAPEDRTIVEGLAELARERAEGEPIWLMSTSVSPAFPIVNLSGTRWASRYCCISFIAASYTREERLTQPFPYHDMNSLSPLEQLQYDHVVEDLQKTPPKLIIVDANMNKQAIGSSALRFVDYFKRDPRFAKMFRSYKLLTVIGPYRVYERRG